ncbi:YgiT-type zinc finger protein [bacterium]|nr:YgiT-type zinc finger protein [bacterium]MBU1615530.1 YgiT-type zinc finger protein [bacterium]
MLKESSIIQDWIDKVTSCAICGGEVKDIIVNHFERYMAGVGTVVFEEVPAQKCEKCGERFYAGEVLKKIDRILGTLQKSQKVVNSLEGYITTP